MNLHVLGVCGTFMGGPAQLAQQLGRRATGNDEDARPPMSVSEASTRADATGAPRL